jgi:hypothetical protein
LVSSEKMKTLTKRIYKLDFDFNGVKRENLRNVRKQIGKMGLKTSIYNFSRIYILNYIYIYIYIYYFVIIMCYIYFLFYVFNDFDMNKIINI